MAKIKCPGISGRQVTVEVGENVKIHPSAKFGPDVILKANVRIGAHCQIGAHCRLSENIALHAKVILGDYVQLNRGVFIATQSTIGARSLITDCKIAQRVSIGAQARCFNTIIEYGAVIGKKFVCHGIYDKTIISQVVIGDRVFVEGSVHLGGRGVAERTTVGNDTQIINRSPKGIVIADYVTIGERCHVEHTNIGQESSIGSDTKIQFANIEECVTIGNRVTIGPRVVIPVQWRIPDNVIVNHHPNGPVVIPRTTG